MKKNAGISTILVTGLAAAISVFTMIILVVLRSTLGVNPDNPEAAKLAEQKADLVNQQFAAFVDSADIDVYWDKTNIAVVFVGSEQINVMWAERKSIYKVTILYDSSNLTKEEKLEQAREKTSAMLGYAGADLVAPGGINQFKVTATDAAAAKLNLIVEYQDGEKKVRYVEKEYTRPWSEGVKASKAQ